MQLHWPGADRRRQLLLIALPIIGGMFSQNVLNLVDIGMVARLGDTALAATGIGSFFNYLSVAIVLGLATGVQATASRRFGEERGDMAALPLNGGLLLAAVVGIPLSMVLIGLTGDILGFLNDDADVVAQSTPYLQVRLLALTAVGMNFAFRGYWSAAHMTRLYFYTIVSMHVVNIFLNWVLIFGNLGAPAMGVHGAGLATTISIYVGLILHFVFAWLYARPAGFLRGLPDRVALRSLINISLPSSVQQVFFSGGLVVLIWILGQIGTAEVAAANVLLTLGLVLLLPAMGVGIACSSLVGRALGRNDTADAQRWGWESATLILFANTAIGLVLLLLAKPLLSIFLQDPETLALALPALMISAVIVGIDTSGLVIMNALLGAGASHRVMKISIVLQWMLFLPLAYLVGPVLGMGLLGVWIVQAVYRLLQTLALALNWRDDFWKEIKV
ncbi:MAG: MATE family efflux transporter [Gammaproteobacteria bacterium]|jgi:MATE family multidrug resistance protein|nr:MATE family efflux transporter [Gammaproteobacteria bacterium]